MALDPTTASETIYLQYRIYVTAHRRKAFPDEDIPEDILPHISIDPTTGRLLGGRHTFIDEDDLFVLDAIDTALDTMIQNGDFKRKDTGDVTNNIDISSVAGSLGLSAIRVHDPGHRTAIIAEQVNSYIYQCAYNADVVANSTPVACSEIISIDNNYGEGFIAYTTAKLTASISVSSIQTEPNPYLSICTAIAESITEYVEWVVVETSVGVCNQTYTLYME